MKFHKLLENMQGNFNVFFSSIDQSMLNLLKSVLSLLPCNGTYCCLS